MRVFWIIGLLVLLVSCTSQTTGPDYDDDAKNYCILRGDVCTLEYRPVCGWFNENVQCIQAPCAVDASNPCTACANEDVDYWTEGECNVN